MAMCAVLTVYGYPVVLYYGRIITIAETEETGSARHLGSLGTCQNRGNRFGSARAKTEETGSARHEPRTEPKSRVVQYRAEP
jgi:hypothetical protein